MYWYMEQQKSNTRNQGQKSTTCEDFHYLRKNPTLNQSQALVFLDTQFQRQE